MKKFIVEIPDESYILLDYEIKDLPAVGVVNVGLKNFEPKEVFAWHLVLTIDFEDLLDNGMPSREERNIVDPFGDELDVLIKGPKLEKPNALFLARETWNKTRQIIWRVFDPEIVHANLQEIINNDSSPRPFEYKIDYDEKWELTKWFLQDHENKK